MIVRQFAGEVGTSLKIQCVGPLIHLGFSSSLVRSVSTRKKKDVEALWRDLFSNTSQWWDHRPGKINPKFPDFKHKETGEALWVTDAQKRPWVQTGLSAILPGTLQASAFAWVQRLRTYVRAGKYLKTMEAFRQMQQERISLDNWTFIPVLNACAGLGALDEGKRVHTQIIQVGCDSDVYVATCLVDMYAKCGSIDDAWTVFNKMQDRDVVSWNAMIGGYVKTAQWQKAMELFRKMQQEGVEPNTVTFVGMLNTCASVAGLEEGRRVHEQIIKRGYESNAYVAACLVDMYSKCGSIEDAWGVFNKMPEHSVFSWSAMIGGYVKSGQGLKAMNLFWNMQKEGVEPDAIIFVGVLNACASVADLEEGRRLHEQIIERGYESNVYVAACLVDMYAKCGSLDDAWSVFNTLRERDVVSWNAMIGGCVKSGQGLKALELFKKMQQERVEPSSVTFVEVLNACASVAALEEGRHVHQQIIRRDFESNVHVATCLVDMYGKCGSIQHAWGVFNSMRERNVVSWNAMIGGYAMHGQAKEAIALFKRMGKDGAKIDEITVTCLLSACSHGGLVNEGLRYFNSTTSGYNILPTLEHYACIIDLLGRAGRLEEAEETAKRMPMERDTAVWMSLLGACRIHRNVEMAERTAKRCQELDPENASRHALLLSIYAAAGQWDRSAAIEEERLEQKVWQEQGRSWTEVNNAVHLFVVNDSEHPQIVETLGELERLSVQMNEVGYMPDRRYTLHKEREGCQSLHHSEKLAVAYGLITTPPGTPLRIKTNLRVCPDCHDALKFIANMVGRVITLKDANRFHRFEGGFCSCRDYW